MGQFRNSYHNFEIDEPIGASSEFMAPIPKPPMEKQKNITRNPLDSIVGHSLSSVEFVMDYSQLHFGSALLTANIWPTIRSKEGIRHYGEPGYRDTLCAQIAKVVRRAEAKKEEGITITFDDGSDIWISLHTEDYTGPEAATFQSKASDPDIFIWTQ